MIQTPQVQEYMPAQQTYNANYQPTGAVSTMQNTQTTTPGVFYNYPMTSSYIPGNSYSTDRAQYNGVNIEVINPQGQGVSPMTQIPAQMYPVQQPVYVQQYPVAAQQPISTQPVQQPVVYSSPVSSAQVLPPQAQPVNPQAAAQVPAPQIQTPAQQVENPVINEPVAQDSSVSPETFAGRLRTDNLDEQEKTLEELATLVKEDETAGPVLLDTQIFDALTEILNKDTSALEGPSPEVQALREKPEAERTEEENQQVNEITPLEKAEGNKLYSLYTIAYMQERLNNELEKLGNNALPLNELPCIENVIETVKSDQDPMLRTGAIASLSRIARPEYKDDLTTIFELAKTDEDPNVQQAAQDALDALSVK